MCVVVRALHNVAMMLRRYGPWSLLDLEVDVSVKVGNPNKRGKLSGCSQPKDCCGIGMCLQSLLYTGLVSSRPFLARLLL